MSRMMKILEEETMDKVMNEITQLKEAFQALETKDEARTSEIEDLKKQMTKVTKENEELKFKVSQLYGNLEAESDKSKTAFFVKWKSPNPLTTGSAMRLENYEETGLVNPCKFMDCKTGIYSTVLPGEYRIMILKSSEDLDVYLCCDDGRRELLEFEKMVGFYLKLGNYGTITGWEIGMNAKIWLEIVPKDADTEIEIMFEGCEVFGYSKLDYNTVPQYHNDDD